MPAEGEKQRESPCVPLESASLPRVRRTLGLVCFESVTEEEFGPRRIFADIILGVALPSFAIVVTVGQLFNEPATLITDLNLYQFFLYAAGLLTWLWLSPILRVRFAPVFAGWLFIAAFDALRVGVHVLPWIFPGLFFLGMGALGITPFLAGYVAARNCVSAIERSHFDKTNIRATVIALVSASLAIVIPYALNWTIHERARIDVISYAHDHSGSLVQWVWDQ